MRELLGLLPRPSHYAGTEEGVARKDPGLAALRVGLAFPDLYEVGMSYLGQKILYGLVNARQDCLAERVFAPSLEAGEILRAHGAPLSTLESDIPLGELDLLGFSVTHELCYTNILEILDLAGIPLRSGEREGGRWPIVSAGGGCTLAAEPIAPFMDVMFLGEGEETLPEFLDLLKEARAAGLPRAAILERAAAIPGVYVPGLNSGQSVVRRRAVSDLDEAFYPVSQVIPFGAVHNRLTLEIGRGCTRGCRFCQAGIIYRPSRERSVANLGEMLNTCLAGTGYDEVSFLSLSSGDFSALKTLFHSSLRRCASEQVSMSLPSLRVGSIDDSIMQGMAGIRRTGATLAPEAGSQRLRDVINKGVSEADLILHVQKLFEYGWQQIKLYFMIGLPTETDEDLLAIIDLAKKARDAAGPGIKRLQITVAVSPFVPKAHTPFQWEEQDSLEEMRRKVGVLLSAVRHEKRIKLRWHDPEMSFLEGIFSRGDRRLAPVVERAWRKRALFTNWMEHFKLAPWLEAMQEEGLDPPDYTGAIPYERHLPWDHLDSGVSRAFLLKERERAGQGKASPDCRYNACLNCGACEGELRNRLNFAKRDQESSQARLDEYGRVVLFAPDASEGEAARELDSEPKPAPAAFVKPGGKSRPPAINAALSRKVCHYRVRYRKEDGAVYLSQLELQAIFERAMRRGGIAPAFSQGFHPLPLISFTRALPVGVGSRAEWLAVYLREKMAPEDVLAALQKNMPSGLQVYAVEALPMGKRPPEAERERFQLIWRGAPDRAGLFHEAWAALCAASSLPWHKEGKKGPGSGKTVDLRAFFQDISPARDPDCGQNRYTFTLNWGKGYLSPLVLCLKAPSLALTGPLAGGDPEPGGQCGGDLFAPHEIALVKIESGQD